MTDAGHDPLDDAMLAASLCAIDPGLGGMILRGGGELRDQVIAAIGRPARRIPVNVDDDRLLGGIDLIATLASGTAVLRSGLLAEADGGVIVLPMAERLPEATAAKIAAAIDGGAALLMVVQDDGIEAEERPPEALAERCAFWIDLTSARGPAIDWQGPDRDRDRPNGGVETDDRFLHAIAATGSALGIESARAQHFALRAARAAALLAGRDQLTDEDVALAARMVLGPRATQMPGTMPDAPPERPETELGEERSQNQEPKPLEDVVLEAALAALPKDVLAQLAAGGSRQRKASRANGAGERRKSAARGRPLGARAGMPGGGKRLALIDTLRAAAPWQRLRGRDGRIEIRRDDLRIRRFETRAEALTIFAVDASGSAALARRAEAKGAVELLLAEAYVKRTQVALVAFRGTEAELLLPPTRSLARARRSLAELPGGGGTPLAAGLNAARELAEAARARGRTPFVVVLTDGRPNIALDGSAVRARAEADATSAAKAIGLARIAAAFVDISARPRPEGATLAAAMGAHYLPLPRADAATMHAAVRAAQT